MLEANDLVVRFDIKGGILQRPVRRVYAVEGVSFTVGRGETLSLIGESTAGKALSTSCREAAASASAPC